MCACLFVCLLLFLFLERLGGGYKNTYRVLRMEMSPEALHAIKRYSVSEQTYCALVVCEYEWIIAGSLYTAFSNIHRSRNSSIWLLYGWCRVKLLPSRRMFCVHHTAMHQFTASLYSKPLALLPGLEVETFRSRVQCSSYHGAILAPVYNFARFVRPPGGPLSHFCLLVHST